MRFRSLLRPRQELAWHCSTARIGSLPTSKWYFTSEVATLLRTYTLVPICSASFAWTECTCFGSTYTKIGTIQRRLAWPLRKDDTQNREAFHIFLARTAGQLLSLLPALQVCQCTHWTDFLIDILKFLASVSKTTAWICCDLVCQMSTWDCLNDQA